MNISKSIILCFLAIIPYLILLRNGFAFSNIDFINFLILAFFLLLPTASTGFFKIFLAVVVSIFYFILILSVSSFGGFLSFGAFSSVMESNVAESVGYVQQFGVFPLIFSIFLALLTFYVLFKFKREGGLKAMQIIFLKTLLLAIIPIYAFSKDDGRLLNEFKTNPESVTAGFYAKSIISPVTNYVAYKKEQSYLARPNSYSLPDNISFGKDSRYKAIYLVIGESASSRNFSYSGYNHPTTPFLDSMKNNSNFYWVDNSISPSPITRDSLKIVLSLATATNHKDYYQYINIVNAANKKGFKTYWLSAQSLSGINDTIIGRVGQSASYSVFNKTDDDLKKELNNKKGEAQRQFFVIHLHGSHAPYNNYTEDDYIKLVESGSSNPDYDATIRKTDRILNGIIRSMSDDSLLIYLSDHGEVIGKGHGLDTPSKDQFEVPFFVYDTSSDRDEIVKFISKLSVNNTFNIQMTMELMLNALGYEFVEIKVPDPLEVYYSDGAVMRYSDMESDYSARK